VEVLDVSRGNHVVERLIHRETVVATSIDVDDGIVLVLLLMQILVVAVIAVGDGVRVPGGLSLQKDGLGELGSGDSAEVERLDVSSFHHVIQRFVHAESVITTAVDVSHVILVVFFILEVFTIRGVTVGNSVFVTLLVQLEEELLVGLQIVGGGRSGRQAEVASEAIVVDNEIIRVPLVFDLLIVV